MPINRALTVMKSMKSSDSGVVSYQRNIPRKPSFIAGNIRNNISAPMELISTTNMLSYNAPDISTPSSSASSSSDSGDFEYSHLPLTSPASSIETSSIESATSCPQPNHLSCYFGSPVPQAEPPSIPKRAPSHTKLNGTHPNNRSSRPNPRLTELVRNSKPTITSSIMVLSPTTENIPHDWPIRESDSMESSLPYTSDTYFPQMMTDSEEQELISQDRKSVV